MIGTMEHGNPTQVAEVTHFHLHSPHRQLFRKLHIRPHRGEVGKIRQSIYLPGKPISADDIWFGGARLKI